MICGISCKHTWFTFYSSPSGTSWSPYSVLSSPSVSSWSRNGEGMGESSWDSGAGVGGASESSSYEWVQWPVTVWRLATWMRLTGAVMIELTDHVVRFSELLSSAACPVFCAGYVLCLSGQLLHALDQQISLKTTNSK